jgi:hypothetical protein
MKTHEFVSTSLDAFFEGWLRKLPLRQIVVAGIHVLKASSLAELPNDWRHSFVDAADEIILESVRRLP